MTYSFRDFSRRTVRFLGIAALGLFGLNAYVALTRTAPATAEPLAFFHGELIQEQASAGHLYQVEVEVNAEHDAHSECAIERHQRQVERHLRSVERHERRLARHRERVARVVERRIERTTQANGQTQTTTIVRVR